MATPRRQRRAKRFSRRRRDGEETNENQGTGRKAGSEEEQPHRGPNQVEPLGPAHG